MDRNQAKEKINKLLRLVNDKGATDSERNTALEMANKIASKHGFKIQKAAPSNATSDKFEKILNNIRYNTNKIKKNRYEFDLNCFNKKHVSAILHILSVDDFFFEGKKAVNVYVYGEFDVVKFKMFYKKFVSQYYGQLKAFGLKDKSSFNMFIEAMKFGYGRISCNYRNSFLDTAYKMGKELSYLHIVDKEV